MKTTTKYSPEFRERAVRMVFEHQGEHKTQWAAIVSIAGKIGCTAETLRKWVRQAERDQGKRAGLTSTERERLKQLERENAGVEAGQRDPAQGGGFFRPGGARPPTEVMVSFIDQHRGEYGVEPICAAVADRPSDLLRAQGARGGAGAGAAAGSARCRDLAGDPARLG